MPMVHSTTWCHIPSLRIRGIHWFFYSSKNLGRSTYLQQDFTTWNQKNSGVPGTTNHAPLTTFQLRYNNIKLSLSCSINISQHKYLRSLPILLTSQGFVVFVCITTHLSLIFSLVLPFLDIFAHAYMDGPFPHLSSTRKITWDEYYTCLCHFMVLRT